MDPAIIRKIRLEDAAGFHAALEAVARERRFLVFLNAPPLVKVEQFIRRNLERRYPQIVAETRAGIVGWADCIPLEREGLEHCASLGLGVIQPFRGQGIGEALLVDVIRRAWEHGLTRLELEVFANNAPAISLYRKLGFEREGSRRMARFLDDEYWDIDIMAKLCTVS